MSEFLLDYLPVLILLGIATAFSLAVAILFIIFDIEVAFLFPYAVSLDQVGFWGWFVVMIFLAELAVGLAYAWKLGALDWE